MDDEEKPESKKIISGKAAAKKKDTFGDKVKEAFSPENVEPLKQYVVQDIVIPQVTDVLHSIATGIVDAFFNGARGAESRGLTPYSSIGNGSFNARYKNYTKISTSGAKIGSQQEAKPQIQPPHVFYFNVHEDAVSILELANDMIQTNDVLSEEDMCRWTGLDHPYTYTKWGWDDLTYARITSTNDPELPWCLILPRAKQIQQ